MALSTDHSPDDATTGVSGRPFPATVIRLLLQTRTTAELRVMCALAGFEALGHPVWGHPVSYFKLGRAIAILSKPRPWNLSNREIRDGLAAAEEDGLIRVRRPAVRCQSIVIEKGERLIAMCKRSATAEPPNQIPIPGATSPAAASEG